MVQLLNHISSFSVLIPLLTSVYKYKRLNGELKVLAWLFMIAAIIEFALNISAIYGIHNIWISNTFMIAEGFVLFFVIGRWFDSEKAFKITMVLFTLYAIYWGYSTFIIGSIFTFNTTERTVKGIMLIFLSGFLLTRLATHEEIIVSRDYRFWIAFAILFYFSLTLIIFGTANLLFEDHLSVIYYTWIIHSIINIISNLLFAYGFVCYYRKMNSYS
jgi:hypothetical protein